jgi:hypothetical protein
MSSGEMNRIIVDFAPPGRLIAPVLAVLLHCTFAQAQTPNDHLIVPWQRIGPMSVGMSAADLVHSMGPPASRQPGEVVTYKWPDVSATVTEDGLWATQICTFDPADVTVEGVHVGSTDLSVTKLLGKPRYSRVSTAWWGPSFANLYWPGLMISAHLKGFEVNHAVWKICVNQFAALAE